MRDVFVTGVGMTPFAKWMERDLTSLTAEAVGAALRDAGAVPGDVGMVFSANCFAGFLSGQESIRGQVFLRGTGLQGLPVFNVENACASASSAFNLAWQAVASGQVESAVAFGVEKLYHPDKQRPFAALERAVDVQRVGELRERLGSDEGQARSLFMDIYRELAAGLSERSGATAEDFARVAAKNHTHGSRNPYAQFRTPLTTQQVLDARAIAGPLTLPMCSPLGDGAAAVVLSAAPPADDPRPRVRVLATAVGSGVAGGDAKTVPPVARRAYEQAGVGPQDLDVVELHDATAPAELILYEELDLCAPGESPKLLASGDTALGGRLPVNPSGGLLSRGHPVGATGCAQLAELVWQLRGEAGERQVEGARVALAENSGGFLDPDVAVSVVTILATG